MKSGLLVILAEGVMALRQRRTYKNPRVPSQQRSSMRPSWRFVSLKNRVYDRQTHQTKQFDAPLSRAGESITTSLRGHAHSELTTRRWAVRPFLIVVRFDVGVARRASVVHRQSCSSHQLVPHGQL